MRAPAQHLCGVRAVVVLCMEKSPVHEWAQEPERSSSDEYAISRRTARELASDVEIGGSAPSGVAAISAIACPVGDVDATCPPTGPVRSAERPWSRRQVQLQDPNLRGPVLIANWDETAPFLTLQQSTSRPEAAVLSMARSVLLMRSTSRAAFFRAHGLRTERSVRSICGSVENGRRNLPHWLRRPSSTPILGAASLDLLHAQMETLVGSAAHGRQLMVQFHDSHRIVECASHCVRARRSNAFAKPDFHAR